MFSKFIKKIIFFCYFSIIIFSQSNNENTFVLARPSLFNIQVFEQLIQQELLTINDLKIIGVYHENEVTDYSPAINYVTEKNIDWVEFIKIEGIVNLDSLFSENIWTEQFHKLFNRSKGIIFMGGADLPPSIYEKEQSLLTKVETPFRSLYESSFLFHLLGSSRNEKFVPFIDSDINYTVLGICLGCQTMNIATGGTLYQDIPTEIYNFQTVEQVLRQEQDMIHSKTYISNLYPLENNFAPSIHKIKLLNGKFIELGSAFSDTPYIISSHHQALNKLGKNLQVIATSLDGKIIEAVEHKLYKNVLGVQFHPEWLDLYSDSKLFKIKPDETPHFNLKSFFINNNNSMDFHKSLWKWFSEKISN